MSIEKFETLSGNYKILVQNIKNVKNKINSIQAGLLMLVETLPKEVELNASLNDLDILEKKLKDKDSKNSKKKKQNG